MPLDPQLGQQLADLGGFALFLLLLVSIGVGLLRQWWVPGWIYRQERADREKADVQALRNVEAIEKLTRAVTRDRSRNTGGPTDA